MTALQLEMLEIEARGWRPLERLEPAAFAEKYRVLKKGQGWVDGPWKNKSAPYLVDVMNAVLECLLRGIRLLVLMKSAQGGGTEALGVNAILWWLAYLCGPILYITAKDELAAEIATDRWDGVEGALAKCAPVAAKHLAGKKNHERVQIKRFTDAKLVFAGSQSVLNFQSNPYVLVVLDEVDSIARAMADGSDPVELAKQRVSAMAEGRPVLVIAFAHPSTPEGHVTKLYRTLSDQRRGHVRCPHCESWIAPAWEHVKVIAREGQTQAEATRDPSCYVFACPGTQERPCGVAWTEADRLRAIHEVPQRSILPPDVAAKKTAIGLHFWKFFMTSKSIRELAEEYIGALDDSPKMRVFVNKTRGEPYEETAQEVTVEVWEKLASGEGATGSFERAKIPDGVRWLTAGTDARQLELHWVVWGWGHVPTEAGAYALCGWLLDYGVEPGPQADDPDRTELTAEDLHVFDEVLYDQVWKTARGERRFTLLQGLHDSRFGRNATYDYCRSHPGRAFPSLGLATDERSNAPPFAFKVGLRFRRGAEIIEDELLKRADLNTFLLKAEFAGLARARFRDKDGVPRTRLLLPRDVTGDVLKHLASEKLVLDPKTNRRSWIKTTHDNHWWDASILAYAGALMTAPPSPSSAIPTAPTVTDQAPRRTWGGGRAKWLRKRGQR